MKNTSTGAPKVTSRHHSSDVIRRKRPISIGTITLSDSGPTLVPCEAEAASRSSSSKAPSFLSHIFIWPTRLIESVGRLVFVQNLLRLSRVTRSDDRPSASVSHRTEPILRNFGQGGPHLPVHIPFIDFIEMYNHCSTFASNHEVMGLLVGDVFCDEMGEYAQVFTTVTGELNADRVHVTFEPAGLSTVVAQVEHIRNHAKSCPIDGNPRKASVCSACGYNTRSLKILGWYHSHPGFTAFMSTTDISTHREYFNQPYHIAIVIDPLNNLYRVWQTAKDSIKQIPLHPF